MNTETNNALSSIMQVNRERAAQYSQASQVVTDKTLSQLFMQLSDQCVKFNEQLSAFLPGDQGSYSAATAAAVPGDRMELLSFSEFAEDSAKQVYDKVMENTERLPPELYEILSGQRTRIHNTHNAIKSIYFNS